MTTIVFAAFVQGLMGIAHCPIMCGPFASIAQTHSRNGVIGSVLYHTGRMTGYATVGGISGLLGSWLNTTFLEQSAAILGAAIIVLYAASILFQFPLPGFLHAPAKFLIPWIRKGGASAVALGLCSALLPCGMLFPAYALAISSGTLQGGVAVMVAFAFGTMPVFIVLALFNRPLQNLLSNWKFNRILPAILLMGSLGLIAYRTYSAEVLCVHPQ
ncbi:MAG: sulfite exporter TauE/SafE family protein [Spirochaetia bacterium]|nr:sulfite exporter TauE/SafE family protein [Spirochaetia bacterium]